MTRYRSRCTVTLLALLAVIVTPGPASPATGSVRPARVPILMYHVITAPPAGVPYPGLFVTRVEFSAQMHWLERHGYHAVTLKHVYDSWRGKRTLPPRPIVITFDDGYRSVFTNALPVLRALRWKGVLNLIVRNQEPGAGGLSPWKVRQLIAAGWEIDSHTMTHVDLTGLDDAELTRQVTGSRRTLRRKYGIPVDFFCYPAGRYNDEVVEAVKAAGYIGATTTEHGLARVGEPYTLARVRVDRGDGASGLAATLASLGA